jgi:hypothetical protein
VGSWRFLASTYDYAYYPHTIIFTHRLKLGFIHPPRLPGDVNRFFRSRTGRHRCTPDRFTDLFTRFVTVSTASTPSYRCNCHHPDGSLASRPLMTPHILEPSVYCSAEKRSPLRQSNLHPAERQLCGYKSTHQRGAIACLWYQSLRNRVGYFGGTGEILGLGIGSFFLCLVWLFGCFCFYV